MKAILVIFDSLNRHMLPPYGCEWIHAPNFQRLAERTVTFENSFIGSAPCMPARRELHTGRYNFLHRSWGPIEPFDDSAPEILKENGVYTHLVTDHIHYYEDGGGTYHNRYHSWELNRGQEGDFWKGYVEPPIEIPPITRQMEANQTERMWVQEYINRHHLTNTVDMPQVKTFSQGIEFIQNNRLAQDWFLQIETFDPHEPFFTHQEFKDLYPHKYDGPIKDWISYGRVFEDPESARHLRYEYAALVSMCDAQLGRLLDVMDQFDLWGETLLIVCSDHGLMLGEHDWWGKNIGPWFNENARTPLFIWDPRTGVKHQRRQSLVQMIDIPATLLDYFEIDLPADMQGVPLRGAVESDMPVREAALFGAFGGYVNITDGRYVYMRGPVSENQPLYEYTLMPTHIRSHFTIEELRTMELSEPFEFSKGCQLLRIEGRPWGDPSELETMLFDLNNDPGQENPLHHSQIESMMVHHLLKLMATNDAPLEQYVRLGLGQEWENHREIIHS